MIIWATILTNRDLMDLGIRYDTNYVDTTVEVDTTMCDDGNGDYDFDQAYCEENPDECSCYNTTVSQLIGNCFFWGVGNYRPNFLYTLQNFPFFPRLCLFSIDGIHEKYRCLRVFLSKQKKEGSKALGQA